MRLAHMTWPKVSAYFEGNDMVLIGIGSVECHGRHLPTGTDTLIPDRLIDMIETRRSDILVAPTIPYGACDSLAEFPGTVNLGTEVLYAVVDKVTESLFRHGARRFIFLNGHGGNARTLDRLGYELQRKGGILAELNWWLMAWDMNPAWKGGHGGAEETAAIMAIEPDWVDIEESGGPLALKDLSPALVSTGFNSVRYKGVEVAIPRLTNSVTDNGWIGPDHPAAATREWGLQMLSTTADYIVDFIEEFRKIPLPVV